jgi:hypothetical protein
MRTLLAVLVIAGLALSAYAQGMGGMSGGPGGKGRHGQHQRGDAPKRKADDKNYKSPLEKLPDQKFDPWGGVREAPQPK